MNAVMKPLFIKFMTNENHYYLYDAKTGEILRVNKEVYTIIDDYHILSDEEIYCKFRKFGKVSIKKALQSLDAAQSRGILCDHFPNQIPKIDKILSGGNAYSVESFIQSHRRQLIIEITDKCNLSCKYCIFGSHYKFGRSQSNNYISLNDFKKCIDDFLACCNDYAALSFYGGEPLLEIDKMNDLLCYAEDVANKRKIKIRFNVTTNGTLLSDKTIHTLVSHNVAVFISFDGDRETHNKYRVFPSKNNNGSYDTIIKNMQRFVFLYPNYKNRGILLTLTATTNLEKSENLIIQLKNDYPLFVSNFVTSIPTPLKSNCYRGIHNTNSIFSDDHSNRIYEHKEQAEFDMWTSEWRYIFDQKKQHFIDNLCQCQSLNDVQILCDNHPIIAEFVKNYFKRIHTRNVVLSSFHSSPVVHVSCFPGAVRTYCSLQGVLYPCERCGFDEIFNIGSISKGLNLKKISDLFVNYIQLVCDCSNCAYNQFCSLCPSHLVEISPQDKLPDALNLQKTCQDLSSERNIVARLKAYVEIMERNPKVLDWLCPKQIPNSEYCEDWLHDVYVKVCT